jgi:hypothetical protein
MLRNIGDKNFKIFDWRDNREHFTASSHTSTQIHYEALNEPEVP